MTAKIDAYNIRILGQSLLNVTNYGVNYRWREGKEEGRGGRGNVGSLIVQTCGLE